MSRAQVNKSQLNEMVFLWLYRAVSICSLALGIFYWIKILGIYPGPLWRFDLMPSYWKFVVVVFAVFYPFASIGLWMSASWGNAIWLICAIIEIISYITFPNRSVLFLILHLVIISIYLVSIMMSHRNKPTAKGKA